MTADTAVPSHGLVRPPLLLLGIASGLSPFGMAIIVPAMNSIAELYDAPLSTVQFVISAYLFGLATAQPVMGYFCDRFGRRRVLLWGFVIFVVASLICAVTPTLELLIAARYLQAVGTSAGTVAARAILRDTCDGNELATAMSYIAAAMGAAPVVAPILGGLLDTYASVSSLFVCTAAIGALVLLAMFRRLPETLSPDEPRPNPSRLPQNYAVLLRSRPFLGNTFLFGFIQGSFFCFLAVGAAYFYDSYGMSSKTFGFIWGLMAIAYVIGATLGARLTERIGTRRVLHGSVALSVLTALTLLLFAFDEPVSEAAIMLPLFLLMVFSGTTTPGAMAGAIRYHPDMAGTASGLSSAAGLVISGSFTVVAGLVYTGTFLPIAGLVALACTLAAAGWLLAASADAATKSG
ncbi:MAG: multidrug effflux MFS transporter [Pseudomonadota bacterium]